MSDSEIEFVKLYNPFYEYENDAMVKSQNFLYYTIFIVIFKLAMIILIPIDSITEDIIKSIINSIILLLTGIIPLLALYSMILEWRARNYKDSADSGRRAAYYLDLVPQNMLNNSIKNLEDKSINLKSKRTNFDNYFVNTSKNTVARHILHFHESAYHQHQKMNMYQRAYKKKYLIIWLPLFGSVVISLLVNYQILHEFLFHVATIIIVSPLTIQTFFAITEWEGNIIKIREIKDKLEDISSVEEYTYLFQEYTIIVRNIPTIPTKDYDKFKPLIEAEYNKVNNEIKNKVEKNFESYSKPN